MTVRVENGDCREVIKILADNSVHAVVTDPPYGLQFMGRHWDTADNVAFYPVFWAEVLRVLKPGGHLIAAGGTRTYHHLACAIEDAGFEIRDAIMWHYGSGFPKSHDVSKAIDRAAGAKREIVGANPNYRDATRNAEHHERWNGAVMSPDQTAPATDVARQWQGWGTALKPATEIFVLARKPLDEKTVAANVQAHGTGAINVDGCRVETTDNLNGGAYSGGERPTQFLKGGLCRNHPEDYKQPTGRWPANIIHDGSEEVIAAFPESESGNGAIKKATAAGHQANAYSKESRPAGTPMICHGDSGSAARFFYTSKADSEDRLGSKHPTVKPVDLMAYLCRLVCPPGGTVLDPFAGSGTTGMACMREGFDCILIEREAEYIADIKRRLAHVKGEDAPLFADRQSRDAKANYELMLRDIRKQ